MKRICLLLLLVSLTVVCAAAQEPAKDAPAAAGAAARNPVGGLVENMETLLSETNRISYAIGVNVARNLQANFPQLNFNFFLLGLRDVFDQEVLKLSEDEINRAIARYNEVSTSVVKKQFNDFKADNLFNADRFLELTGRKEGVTTLTPGLQYRVLSPGNPQAPAPKPDGTVLVQYHATALNGRTVDSTLDGTRKGPLHIQIKEAPLPFWREILPKMHLGAKWEVYVHPKFAYGENGSDRAQPNELLVYKVEVVGLQ